jgi:hypothetical protein
MDSGRCIFKSIFVVVAVLTFSMVSGVAQISTDRVPDDPIEPGLESPVNLGAIINSSSDEPQVAITHSGLSLYFCSDRPGSFGKLDIWISHRTTIDAPWGEPRNAGSMINGPNLQYCPSFPPDDREMFFTSGRQGGFGKLDIYVTHRLDATDDFGWQQPVNLGPSINTSASDADPVYFVDPKSGEATLYFISNRQGVSNGQGGFLFDIYQSKRNEDGSFQPAVLNKELSSPYDDRRMTIRRDGLLLIFTSDRPGGVGGLDLWVSRRSDTHSPWGEPVNLGPPVNSEADERGSALADDGVTLFFSSNRAGSFGQDDLWATSLKRRHRNRGPQTPERN